MLLSEPVFKYLQTCFFLNITKHPPASQEFGPGLSVSLTGKILRHPNHCEVLADNFPVRFGGTDVIRHGSLTCVCL